MNDLTNKDLTKDIKTTIEFFIEYLVKKKEVIFFPLALIYFFWTSGANMQLIRII